MTLAGKHYKTYNSVLYYVNDSQTTQFVQMNLVYNLLDHKCATGQ